MLDRIRTGYHAARRIGRAIFPGKADQLTLTLTGSAPKDTDEFISHARSADSLAAQEPWSAKFSRRGFKPARLETLTNELDALIDLGSDASEARLDAIASTAGRNEAFFALRAWMSEFKGVARAALEDQPGALEELGL